jgi:hypothetical protein
VSDVEARRRRTVVRDVRQIHNYDAGERGLRRHGDDWQAFKG